MKERTGCFCTIRACRDMLSLHILNRSHQFCFSKQLESKIMYHAGKDFCLALFESCSLRPDQMFSSEHTSYHH